MDIHGRKIGLLFSVGAKYEIGMLDKSLDNFMRTVKVAPIMSRYYEEEQRYKDSAYKPQPLTEQEVMGLSDAEFAQLCEEVGAAFQYGNNITVEAEKSPKKEEEASSSTIAGASTTE